MHTQWRLNNYKRLPPGAEQYIGMNDLQVARAVKQAEKEVEVLQEQSINKQKELNEKYNTH